MQRAESARVFESVRSEFVEFLRAAGRAPATIRAYTADLKRIAVAGPIVSLADFQEAVVNTAIIEWGRGAAVTGPEPGATVNRMKSAVRALAKWCRRRGYLDQEFVTSL